ncbi:hypothetical protein EV174_001133 [Coemansia sp. RSA 2320]|nr:hypothetical protein EV174_001133 [Coemansia sp. RSA 2320]
MLPVPSTRFLLLVLACASGLFYGARSEPLAVRQAQLRREWTEYLVSSAAGDPFLVDGSSQLSRQVAPVGADLVKSSLAYYFDQKADHFSHSSKTFKQKLLINAQHYTSGGPVYLFNSGETPASASYLWAGEPYTLAKATGGMLLIMEHRYYGVSYPVSDMSGINMVYLTVENSLEDMANFVRSAQSFVQQAVGVTISQDSKWVAVGGSYAANLATWMRLKYPELIHAAYASSAPVRAEADFYEYDQVVGQALPCAQSIADAISMLDLILDSRNRTLINSWKQACGLGELKDDADFAAALTDQMSNTVQYYMPAKTGDAITLLCSWFGRTQNNALQNLADMMAAYVRKNDIDVVSAYASNVGSDNVDLYQDGRSWFYQTCTQFGYWQSAPRPPLRRLRSKYMTAEWQARPCRAFFGDVVPARPDTAGINERYGGLLPNVTRVVFVNGLLDPWSSLSLPADPVAVLKATFQGQNAVITMPRASHVADFYFAPSRTDFGVDVARRQILDAISDFLAQPS